VGLLFAFVRGEGLPVGPAVDRILSDDESTVATPGFSMDVVDMEIAVALGARSGTSSDIDVVDSLGWSSRTFRVGYLASPNPVAIGSG
jgi:hypothetical protein